MILKRTTIVMALGLIFNLSHVALAREGASDVESFPFRVFGDRIYEGIYFSSPGGLPRELKFYSNFRSPEYHLEESHSLSFYFLPGEFSEENYLLLMEEEGPLPYPPAAQVFFQTDLSREWDLPLFIFLSHPSSETPRVFAIEDADDHFSYGEVIIFNGTEMLIEGELFDGRSERIDFGLHGPFALERRNRIHLTTRRNGVSRTVFEGSLNLTEDERMIFFLLPPLRPGSTEAQFRMVRDRKPPILEEEHRDQE